MAEPDTVEQTYEVIGRLINAYVMGDMFRDVAFMNTVMRCLMHRMRNSHLNGTRNRIAWTHIRNIWIRLYRPHHFESLPWKARLMRRVCTS